MKANSFFLLNVFLIISGRVSLPPVESPSNRKCAGVSCSECLSESDCMWCDTGSATSVCSYDTPLREKACEFSGKSIRESTVCTTAINCNAIADCDECLASSTCGWCAGLSFCQSVSSQSSCETAFGKGAWNNCTDPIFPGQCSELDFSGDFCEAQGISTDASYLLELIDSVYADVNPSIVAELEDLAAQYDFEFCDDCWSAIQTALCGSLTTKCGFYECALTQSEALLACAENCMQPCEAALEGNEEAVYECTLCLLPCAAEVLSSSCGEYMMSASTCVDVLNVCLCSPMPLVTKGICSKYFDETGYSVAIPSSLSCENNDEWCAYEIPSNITTRRKRALSSESLVATMHNGEFLDPAHGRFCPNQHVCFVMPQTTSLPLTFSVVGGTSFKWPRRVRKFTLAATRTKLVGHGASSSTNAQGTTLPLSNSVDSEDGRGASGIVSQEVGIAILVILLLFFICALVTAFVAFSRMKKMQQILIEKLPDSELAIRKQNSRRRAGAAFRLRRNQGEK